MEPHRPGTRKKKLVAGKTHKPRCTFTKHGVHCSCSWTSKKVVKLPEGQKLKDLEMGEKTVRKIESDLKKWTRKKGVALVERIKEQYE